MTRPRAERKRLTYSPYCYQRSSEIFLIHVIEFLLLLVSWQIAVSESSDDPEAYFKQMLAVNALKAMGSKVKSKTWGRALSKGNLFSLSDSLNRYI
jgi:hypothetical protein